VKAWKFLVPVSVAAALAMVPQDPAPQSPPNPDAARTDPATIVPMSELKYTTLQGSERVLSARTVVEIRLFEDSPHNIRLELAYENGDYSMIDATEFHVLRSGTTREVKLVRTKLARMRFPRLL
jgi:hypothetical protein